MTWFVCLLVGLFTVVGRFVAWLLADGVAWWAGFLVGWLLEWLIGLLVG